MFIKSTLAKFEWKGQPKELPDLFIENLLLHSSTYNFAVTNFKSSNKDDNGANGEFWSLFTVLEYEPKYKRPKRIQVVNGMGETFATNDFVLFNNYKNTATLNSSYINYYSQVIKQINKALEQHITASQLIATIYASNGKEAADLKKIFSNFDGVMIVEHSSSMPSYDNGGKRANVVQFEIEPRLKELEDLKHEIEKDLFLRLAIDYGTDKTHITNLNLEDSEQVIDLVNAYENKLRQDFCARYNEWKKGANLTCKIHEITRDNTVEKREGEKNDNDRI